MYQTNTQLKASARKNLLGHYGAVIGALLVMVLFALLVNIPFSNMLSLGFYFGAIMRIVVGILGMVIVMLISFLLFIGNEWIHLRLSRGEPARFTDMFYPFTSRPERFFAYELLLLLLALPCLLPGAICILLSPAFAVVMGTADSAPVTLMLIGIVLLIVGAVFYVRVFGSWFMAPFLMLDKEDLRAKDSIRASRKLMKGKRGKWFLMMLSFIGWLLLSLLSFGIALIWIAPYFIQSLTCFYVNLLPPDERRYYKAEDQTASDSGVG